MSVCVSGADEKVGRIKVTGRPVHSCSSYSNVHSGLF